MALNQPPRVNGIRPRSLVLDGNSATARIAFASSWVSSSCKPSAPSTGAEA